MNDSSLKALIQELNADPIRFFEKGKSYDLLQQYFEGASLDTLRSLLKSENQVIRRVAIFVTSELGKQGCSLLDEVIPLLQEEDRYITYHALEVMTACSAVDARVVLNVVACLESADQVIRVLAMRLLAKIDVKGIDAAAQISGLLVRSNDLHKKYLIKLGNLEALEPQAIAIMIEDSNPIARKYGAIAAKKVFGRYPDLMTVVYSSADADLKKFGDDER